MRVALLFYGRLRFFDKTYKNFMKVFEGHTIDIFYSADNEPEEEIEEFKRLYNPIAVNNTAIVHSIDYSMYPLPPDYGVNPANMIRHFINLRRVCELMETNTSTIYDVAVCTRLDIMISSVSLPIIKPPENTIYIPNGFDYFGINDRFAMGDVETVKKYMLLIDNCKYLFDNKLAFPHPETVALANLKFHNISIIRFHMDYSLLR